MMRAFDLNSTTPGRGHRKGGVIAIGNFDGVHRGHIAVIEKAVALAQEIGTFAGAMTFEPYPAEFFRPDLAPPRLSSRRQKFNLLVATGIEQILVMRFGRRLASTSAEAFVDRFLVDELAVRHVIVGEDFRYGAARKGDVEALRRAGSEKGFNVTAIGDFTLQGERVSSSRIRSLLSQADLATASELLGRPFSWTGRVVHGDKRGRTIGFPTANFVVGRKSFPLNGVFVVRMDAEDGFSRYGVANVGVRPTVGVPKLLIEVHLFDFSGDIYGRMMNVTFLHRIRDEMRFPDFEALRARIMRDAEEGREWLINNGMNHA